MHGVSTVTCERVIRYERTSIEVCPDLGRLFVTACEARGQCPDELLLDLIGFLNAEIARIVEGLCAMHGSATTAGGTNDGE